MKFRKLTTTQHPDFDEVVLLLEKGEKSSILATGKLKSINKDGFVFDIGGIGDIFGYRSIFKPTHYTRIELNDIEE